MSNTEINFHKKIQLLFEGDNSQQTTQSLYQKSTAWKKMYEIGKKERIEGNIEYVCLFFAIEFSLKSIILKQNPSCDIKSLGHNYQKMLDKIKNIDIWHKTYSFLEEMNLLDKEIDPIRMRYPGTGNYYTFDNEITSTINTFFEEVREYVLSKQ